MKITSIKDFLKEEKDVTYVNPLHESMDKTIADARKLYD